MRAGWNGGFEEKIARVEHYAISDERIDDTPPQRRVGICRDYAGTKVAALMKNGEPLGVNAMYLDGHAEWVPKKRMKARYVGGGVTVYF